MTDLAAIPQIAEDTNYAAGSEAWSGQPTKVAPNAGFASKGWIPGENIPAEFENYFRHALKEAVKDAQLRAAVKNCAGGYIARNTGNFYAWGRESKQLLGCETISGFYYVVGASPDLRHYGDTTNALDGLQTCNAWGHSVIAYFVYGMLGNTGTYQVIDDQFGKNVANKTPPTAGAKYHDGCTDEETGNAVLLSGGIAGTTAFGWAYGDPDAGLSWLAFSGSWVADSQATLASKSSLGSDQLLIAISPDNLVYSDDGGVTSTWAEPTWTGATAPATGTGFRACYDYTNNQWIYCTSDCGADQSYALATGVVWKSLNGGADWTAIATGICLVDVVYFQGWLWGMALMGLEHHGLEVCYSRDGGVTWEFPGIPVTMAYTTLANATYYKLNRIVKTDNALVFQSAIDAVGWTGTKQVEYVTIQVGA